MAFCYYYYYFSDLKKECFFENIIYFVIQHVLKILVDTTKIYSV